jgi:type I restriction enzyme S subunit
LNDLKDREFLFYAISNLKETIELYGGIGATMTNLSKGKFEQLQILSSSEDILVSFHKITLPLFEKIKNLQLQIIHLRRMRDNLLPRLMSGH